MITQDTNDPFYATQILNVLQIDTTDTNLRQAQVMIDALLKFAEKNALYVDLWKDGGAEDSVRHVEHKGARLKAFVTAFKIRGDVRASRPDLDAHEQAMIAAFNDDGLDLINYAAFALRNMHSRRLTATEPVPDGWRPTDDRPFD
jgi:hypothetical protein